MRFVNNIVAAVCVCAWYGNVMAASDPAAREKSVVKEQLASSDDGDGKSTGAGFTSKAVVEAQEGKGTATVRLARLNEWNDSTYVRSALVVSTPFNSDKDDSKDIGTLSGLSKGSSAALEFGVLAWPPFPAASEASIRAVCEAAIPQLLEGFNWDDTSNAPASIYYNYAGGMGCEERLFDALDTIVLTINTKRDAEYKVAVEKAAAANTTPPTAPKPVVLHPDSKRIIEDAKRRIRRVNAEGFKGLHNFNLKLLANRQDFSYVVTTDLNTVVNDVESGKGASLSYAWVNARYVVSGGYQYERNYVARPAKQVCQPIENTTATSCVTATIGAPSRKTSDIGFLEMRRHFDGKLPFAISPRLEYDFDTNDVAVRLPVYLVANGAGELVSGVTLGWTEEDEFGVSVFFGKAFSFFGD